MWRRQPWAGRADSERSAGRMYMRPLAHVNIVLVVCLGLLSHAKDYSARELLSVVIVFSPFPFLFFCTKTTVTNFGCFNLLSQVPKLLMQSYYVGIVGKNKQKTCLSFCRYIVTVTRNVIPFVLCAS